mgnify:CR=1 FL=1
MTRKWTYAQRRQQAENIQKTKPWLKAGGPQSRRGKARSSQNAYKHGLRSADCRELIRLLRNQARRLATLSREMQLLISFDIGDDITYIPCNRGTLLMTYNKDLLDKAKRHREKQKNPDRPMGKKPDWIRVKAPQGKTYEETRDIVRRHKLTTVCEEAGCPNVGECWNKKHATFMIMGEVCTRACSFCNVATGKPDDLDSLEPLRVGVAVMRMGLKHVVITSVDRDDLADSGADHFVKTIQAIRMKSPGTTIEILPGDFRGKLEDVDLVADAMPDVFNHNLETVPRLYPTIRPGARYFRSLRLLERVKERHPNTFTKSGLMVGLGESRDEVAQVMDDMRSANIDFITIGQYLQPTPKHAPVDKFWTPEEFEGLERMARAKGFLMVSATPLTRSSYHAEDDFMALKAARDKKLAGQAAE